MLAHHRAAAQRRETDGAVVANAGLAVAPAHGFVFQRNLAAFGGGGAQKKRGARGRIHLHLVVHFQNLDIVGGQGLGGALDQRRQQGHTQAHIAGFHDHGMTGRRFDPFFLFGGKARGADHMHDARLGGEVGQHQRHHGTGEIDHRLRRRDQRQRIGCERNAVGRKSRKLARIAAQIRMPFGFQRARQNQPRRLGDLAHQGAAHPA